MAEQTLSIDDAMQLAVNAWLRGENDPALNLARQILAVRPEHRGAHHLRLTLEHGVNNLHFTAIHLHQPTLYSIGDFSYGVPAVFHHNQPSEPARLSIGNYCTIAHDVKIILGSYHRHDWHTIYPFSAPHLGSLFASTRDITDFSATRGGVTIGNDVWIGAHTIILSGVTIGDGAVVAAGSVVSRDIGPYEIWAGNPAQLIKRRFDEETSARLLALRWWDWSKEDVEANARWIMNEGAPALDKLKQAKAAMLHKARSPIKGMRIVSGASGQIRMKVPQTWKKGAPTWLVLHGSLGAIETVQDFEARMPEANLVFADLPGSGQSWRPTDYSAEGFARELLPAIGQVMEDDYRVLGVSFGGAVGLAMAREDARCKGVVLVDTPFSAKKLWHNHAFLRNVLASAPDNLHKRQFAWDIYGVSESALAERTFWHLLDGLAVPVNVVTGDVPLHPQRQTNQLACCLDKADLEALRHRGIPVTRTRGGHDLIHDNPESVKAVMVAMAERADAVAA
ncbi:alpha/beta fold hydrolase [Cupriavidus plantarum]|uniref:Transferase family hexapeptide repeat protein n=1 Tax=Cupriavidus plantarum TaxID=942865 RepID=A0A316EV03_9BURK|nr:alpha/beta fold hydrolase [Cupriavidus plantarum]PWK35572.1 transferase family hexapeptide repeat protein [Cupriavidus plantarum]